jgi:hypothetical protein
MQLKNGWKNAIYQLYYRKEKNPIIKSINEQFKTKDLV